MAMTAATVQANEDGSNRLLSVVLLMLSATIILLTASVLVFWQRQEKPRTLPRPVIIMPRPAIPMSGEVITQPKPLISPEAELSPEAWKQRALTAEAVAGKQAEVLREKMIPELAEFAKQSLVQGLVTQRNVLMETQHKAQQALTELEARMNTLQTLLQERVRVYEKRIAELEQEVHSQGEEVRELTRATLALVRKKLADEQESGRLESRFN